jgi:DNA-binding NarL/FixJ family response regulator
MIAPSALPRPKSVRNGRDAVEEVERLDPDVLVMEISMPVLDGLRAASQISANRRTKVVFLTLHDGRDFVGAAFSASAYGHVLKSSLTKDLVPSRHVFDLADHPRTS